MAHRAVARSAMTPTGTPSLVCLIGAECSGKTTLAQALAAHFGGLWLPEYLREFCVLHGRTPRADEQAMLMRTQFEQEEAVLAQATRMGSRYVFCDGAPLLTAIYSEHYFSDPSLFDCAHALHARYALTLCLGADLPWVADGLQRDGEAVRAAIHSRIQRVLQAWRYPEIDIAGGGGSRLQAAILAVETLTG